MLVLLLLMAGRRVILDLSLEPNQNLVEHEGEEEQHEQERPEMLHEKARGIELEQAAKAHNGDEKLPDHYALDRTDDAEAHAGEDLGQRRPDIDAAERLPRASTEAARHFDERRRYAFHAGTRVEDDDPDGKQNDRQH